MQPLPRDLFPLSVAAPRETPEKPRDDPKHRRRRLHRFGRYGAGPAGFRVPALSESQRESTGAPIMKQREQQSTPTPRRHSRLLAAATGVALAGIAIPAAADHGLPHIQQLARGEFVDEVAATIKSKGQDNGTEVTHIKDASDMVVLEITLQPGGLGPWHTHSGGGLLVNMGPGTLTNVVGEDCEPRQFFPGEAFVDPGHGVLHAVRNDGLEEVVLVAVFFGIEDGPVTPEPGPADCAFLP